MAHPITPRKALIARETEVSGLIPILPNQMVLPAVEIQPMSQRIEIRDGREDWTGKTSTALRRKLQNRLNQRAARRYGSPTIKAFLTESRPKKAARKRKGSSFIRMYRDNAPSC